MLSRGNERTDAATIKLEIFIPDVAEGALYKFEILTREGLPRLKTDAAPLTEAEFTREERAYADYVAAFTREQAARPALSFVITSLERPSDLSQFERWYERDAGERVGEYIIYRVRLRP